MQELILPVIYAFFASLAYAFLFNIHGINTVYAAVVGACGWLAYLLTGYCWNSTIIQSLVAGLTIAALSELMSRLRRCPSTGFLLVAFFPLVPGGGIYYTMKYCIEGDRSMFYTKLLETIGIAGALAVGVLMVSSTLRLISVFRTQQEAAK